jgi:hypothetical protein
MASVNHEPITLAIFNRSIAAASRHFSRLQEKYPEMLAYLVISSQGRQVEISQPLKQMILNHPNLMAVGDARNRMQGFLKNTPDKEPTETEKKKQATRFQQLAEELEYDPTQQFELRFHRPDYVLIAKLQSDSLTDQALTPKSKTSIRIVLGTVRHFARKKPITPHCH